jgi:predicted transposase YdaD
MGIEKWILIHTEVQGYGDKYFPLRMYTYNYRSYDRFNQNVVGFAILTDENLDFRPTFYEQETWGTKIRYDFQAFKVLDYDEAYYEKFKNPFASVMLVARSFLRNKSLKTDEDLLSLKLQLFRTMYEKGYNKDIIRKIANFIKLYVSFKNNDYFIKFETELDKITKYQPTMGLLELIKQRTIEEAGRIGKEEGLEQGLEQGLEKGLEKGLEQGVKKTIEKMLAKDFSAERIADILEIAVVEVEAIEQEITIKTYFQEAWTIEKVVEQFDETEQTLLFSATQLIKLHQEVAVEQLLTEELSVQEIMEKLDLTEIFVKSIQKMMKK